MSICLNGLGLERALLCLSLSLSLSSCFINQRRLCRQSHVHFTELHQTSLALCLALVLLAASAPLSRPVHFDFGSPIALHLRPVRSGPVRFSVCGRPAQLVGGAWTREQVLAKAEERLFLALDEEGGNIRTQIQFGPNAAQCKHLSAGSPPLSSSPIAVPLTLPAWSEWS